MSSIFTYGSLMFAEVWERVVRGRYASAPATLSGYARYGVRSETYPGMVAQTGGNVRGVVYFDVGDADIAGLDAFEGEDYRRDMVPADIEGVGIASVSTYVYLRIERLLDTPWDAASFRMSEFMDTYCAARLDR